MNILDVVYAKYLKGVPYIGPIVLFIYNKVVFGLIKLQEYYYFFKAVVHKIKIIGVKSFLGEWKKSPEKLFDELQALQGTYFFGTFSGYFSLEEIQLIVEYYWKKKNLLPTSLKIFKNDLQSYITKDDFLRISLLGLKNPKIFKRFSKRELETATLDGKSVNDLSSIVIKNYVNERINYAVSQGYKSLLLQSSFKTSKSEETIKDVNTFLNKAGIRFFIIDSTLLGAIREKGFIQNIISLGVHESEASLSLCSNSLLKSGLFKKGAYSDYHAEMTHENGTTVQIFLHYLESGLLVHRNMVCEWYNVPFSLTSILLSGEKVLIPSNYNLYLAEKYGNWKDRMTFFDSLFDSHNMKYISSVESLEYFSSIIKKSIKGSRRHGFVCSNRALKQAFSMDFSKYYPTTSDGDVMDNIKPRKQLLILSDSEINKKYAQIIEKLILLLEGFNIKVDINIIGKNIDSDIERFFKAFYFIETVEKIDKIESINKDLSKYDQLILSDSEEYNFPDYLCSYLSLKNQ